MILLLIYLGLEMFDVSNSVLPMLVPFADPINMEMIMGPDSQGWLRCNRGGCPTLLPPQAVSPIAATSFAGLVARSLPRKVSASPVRLI